LAAKFPAIFPHLDERQRRLLMGAEARALGHGGIRAVARAAWVREATVSLGAGELDSGAGPLGRARRPGGGRKRAAPSRLRGSCVSSSRWSPGPAAITHPACLGRSVVADPAPRARQGSPGGFLAAAARRQWACPPGSGRYDSGAMLASRRASPRSAASLRISGSPCRGWTRCERCWAMHRVQFARCPARGADLAGRP
jgi:hypothetical protein